jgi:hypothetical protein
MTPDPLIAQELERQSVVTMECTIPGDMTVAQWRQLRPKRRRTGLRAAARKLPRREGSQLTLRAA